MLIGIISMVIWSTSEKLVFVALLMMVILKLWTVWHVANRYKASCEGRMIFVWGITGMTAFAVVAKSYVSYQMGG